MILIKKYVLSIPLLLSGFFCFSQTVKIPLERFHEDEQFQKSQAILPVYQYEKDTIEPYSKFGVAMLESDPSHIVKKMPNMEGVRDTGYTYIHFSGADKDGQGLYVLAMVGNYKRWFRTPVIFYVDRNNDMDFTNDGPPDTLHYSADSIILTLENVNVPNALYSIKLTRFETGKNQPYKKLLTEHYKKHSGTKIFTDVDYCYREQRYNAVMGKYRVGNDSFFIGLKDVNINGIYADACLDKYYVGPVNSTMRTTELKDITPTVNKNQFEWNGKVYQFVSIENTGQYIEIKKKVGAKASNQLREKKRVPKFEYTNILNNKVKLTKYRKSEVFLYFWDLESLTEEDTMYLGKIHREFSEDITLITLNHGDEPKRVRINYYYDKWTWPVGYSNNRIAKKYFVEDIPHGFLIGKRRKLKQNGISPKEVYEYLSKKKKQSSSS